MFKKQSWRVMRKVLKSLKAGASINAACSAADISTPTLWAWRKKDDRLDVLIKTIYDSRVQIVEDALYKSALEGSNTAQIFFLKNRAIDRWRENDFVFDNSQHYHYTKINDDKIIDEATKRGLALPDEIARRVREKTPAKQA